MFSIILYPVKKEQGVPNHHVTFNHWICIHVMEWMQCRCSCSVIACHWVTAVTWNAWGWGVGYWCKKTLTLIHEPCVLPLLNTSYFILHYVPMICVWYVMQGDPLFWAYSLASHYYEISWFGWELRAILKGFRACCTRYLILSDSEPAMSKQRPWETCGGH